MGAVAPKKNNNLRKILKERRSHLHRGRNPKSRACVCVLRNFLL